MTCFYFYLWDAGFGPGFIKVCAYFSYPVKAWVNGHEWAKRQCARTGIECTALSGGFASCQDPARLQAICDRLGPGTINEIGQVPAPPASTLMRVDLQEKRKLDSERLAGQLAQVKA